MKTGSQKKSLKLGKVIASVYEVYFPGDHGHYGTDADHVPVIPGNNFAPQVGGVDGSQLQNPAPGNVISGQSSIDD
ncbi:MAG: hypothetical protein LV479_10120 [Methylacidiphilales bacterium]|nr:hypothetical protein [Candidatus Methylacidiphilales bacterium]